MLRSIIDIGMVALLPLLMARHLTGEAAHEWIGAAMLALLIFHLALNSRWFPALLRGRYGAARVFHTAVNLLLLADILMMAVSGIMMSEYAFPFLSFPAGASFARRIHLPCAFWGFLLMSLHIGLHWQGILGRVKALAHGGKASAGRRLALRALALLASAYGVYAFFKRQFPDYLFLKESFAFFDFDEPLLPYLLDMAAIMTLFAVLGHGLAGWLGKAKKANQE